MKIGGFQKFSLTDFPGKISCVIFTKGCDFRCVYCHNPELFSLESSEEDGKDISLNEIYGFLEKRRGKIDGVVITGGEPALHSDLPDVIKKIRSMGFSVKLDTNGSNFKMLEKIISEKIVDYIAMDIKAPFEKNKYEKIIGREAKIENIKRSAELIINSGIRHEFRTTVLKTFLNEEDLLKIAESVAGAENYYLQKFVSFEKKTKNVLKFSENDLYSEDEFKDLAKKCRKFVKNCFAR